MHIVFLILPLRGVTIPTEAKEREEFFNKLGVFIEHSDGGKVFIKGEVVPYKNGELELKFTINKFSTFTIINMENSWEQPSFNVLFFTIEYHNLCYIRYNILLSIR